MPARRPAAIAYAVAAIVLLALISIVGINGLRQTPIVSTHGSIAALKGTFEPYSCSATGSDCRGYVAAGGRSVFLIIPPSCARPAANSIITVTGVKDPSLGSATYRASGCPSPAS